jgi:hypothetical protein
MPRQGHGLSAKLDIPSCLALILNSVEADSAMRREFDAAHHCEWVEPPSFK